MKSPRQRMTPERRKLYDRIRRRFLKANGPTVDVNKLVREQREELERKGK